METCGPATGSALLRDFRSAQAAGRAGIVPARADANDRVWLLWERFCHDLHADPWLSNIADPVMLLQVFSERYRTGIIAPSGKPVRSRTVEAALRAVGQTFAKLGAPDPRLSASGKLEFRLQRQLRGYARQDPAPSRVKPIPVQVLRHAMQLAHQRADVASTAVADIIATNFFFLFRPGEATASTADTVPFRLQDVHFFVGIRRVPAVQAKLQDLLKATFVTFTFTDQKNSVRGEVLGLGPSGDPLLCPVKAAARRVRHLLANKAAPTTLFCTYYEHGRAAVVTPTAITNALRASVQALGPTLGFSPAEVSARSLRASGAMALLCARVDPDTIRLLGRWKSDTMYRYLTVQAEPIMRGYASRMLQSGTYTLLPGNTR